MATIEYITTGNQGAIIFVKFGFTPNVTAITTDNFELWTTGSTPTEIASPFRDIDPYADYNSTSRTLTLYVDVDLDSNTTYLLKAMGLKNTMNATVASDSEEFTTGEFVTPDDPEPDVIDVEDHSVVVVTDPQDAVLTITDGSFYVTDTDPENGSYDIPSDYAEGRITIVFNQAVAFAFVNSTYFKGQRKLIAHGYHRWEDIDVQVEQDLDPTIIYVNFPSNDATPLYATAGATYFETGYKYRVKVSESVATYDS
jgi:hypothetical protein